MKKFIFMLVAMFATVTMSAQTVEKSKFFDNTYVSVSGGAFGWLHPTCHSYDNFGESLRGVGSLRLGKFVTPVLGLELDGEVGMANRGKFVDHTMIGANMLFNMNNTFHPYRGEPDGVEFVPFLGLGWYRMYDTKTDNLASKFGMQINFNLGEKKAWQINVIPSINYIMTDDGFGKITNQPRLDAHRAHVNLQVGVTYKFKNSKKTHNFVISPFCHTQQEWDDLVNKMNEVNRQNDELKEHTRKMHHVNGMLAKENHELKKRPTTINNPMNLTINSAIGFEIGSVEILPTQRANILSVAKALKDTNSKIEIIGFADSATGSTQRNLELSHARAEAVANALVECGVNKDNITIVGKGVSEQIFDENDANRVVIFTTY